MALQSEMTSPSNPSWPLSTSVMSSLLACILIGLFIPSSVQSTLEKDGMTEPTWCLLTAGPYGASASSSNSGRDTSSTPWSTV